VLESCPVGVLKVIVATYLTKCVSNFSMPFHCFSADMSTIVENKHRQNSQNRSKQLIVRMKIQ